MGKRVKSVREKKVIKLIMVFLRRIYIFKTFIFVPAIGAFLYLYHVCTGHSVDSLRFLIISPVDQFNVFIFFLFTSFMLSIESRGLRNRRDQISEVLSDVTSIGRDIEKMRIQNKAPKKKTKFDKNLKAIKSHYFQIYRFELVAFVFNLLVNGYIALCISHALLTKG